MLQKFIIQSQTIQSIDKVEKNHYTQLNKVYEYLWENVATASMIAEDTGIPQKCICRYKRNLQRRGLLWEVEKKHCKLTGYTAAYLTTNPKLVYRRSSQLILFEEDTYYFQKK